MITFMTKPKNQDHPQSQSWRLTDNFLVEHLAEGRARLWGRWDRHFGCWDGDEGREIFPDGPVLGRLGTWFEPSGNRDDSWYASRASVAAYWSIVPTSVRLMAAGGGDLQWAVLMGEWQRRKDKNSDPQLPQTRIVRPKP